MADKYLNELAALGEYQVCPNQGPWARKEGIAIAARDGYIVCIGPAQSAADSRQSAVNIMVRFGLGVSAEAIQAAIAGNPAVLAALEEKEFEKKHVKQLQVDLDFLIYSWGYSFKKPPANRVNDLANGLLEAVKSVAPSFGGKCELCKNSYMSEIILFNGVPGYFCASCQEAERMKLDQAGREYEAKETNLVNGLALGIIAALVGSIAWGGIAYLANRIFLYGAVGIGFLIGWAFFKGSGKVENVGRIIVAVLTVASVLFGDAIFFTLTLMKI